MFPIMLGSALRYTASSSSSGPGSLVTVATVTRNTEALLKVTREVFYFSIPEAVEFNLQTEPGKGPVPGRSDLGCESTLNLVGSD